MNNLDSTLANAPRERLLQALHGRQSAMAWPHDCDHADLFETCCKRCGAYVAAGPGDADGLDRAFKIVGVALQAFKEAAQA